MSFFDRFLTRERQQKLKRRYIHKVMLFISKTINITCRKRFHITDYVKDNNFIACLWHGNFLMMPYLYAKAREIPNMCLITAAHNDGAMVEQYFEQFGLESIRGSTGTHKGGTKALIQAVRALKEGKDVAVTPDGPKGPYKISSRPGNSPYHAYIHRAQTASSLFRPDIFLLLRIEYRRHYLL